MFFFCFSFFFIFVFSPIYELFFAIYWVWWNRNSYCLVSLYGWVLLGLVSFSQVQALPFQSLLLGGLLVADWMDVPSSAAPKPSSSKIKPASNALSSSHNSDSGSTSAKQLKRDISSSPEDTTTTTSSKRRRVSGEQPPPSIRHDRYYFTRVSCCFYLSVLVNR